MAHDTDLSPYLALGDRFSSATQKARVISEAWAARNAFCFSCGGPLERARNNARVHDFSCVRCSNEFELKSTRGSFSKKLPDGAFSSMMARLNDVSSPDFLFLCFDVQGAVVTDFFAVPTCFLDPTVIEKRKPLSSTARRAGWVGCNIVLHRIPDVGKVFYIRDRKVADKASVIEAWGRTEFLKHGQRFNARGWTLEILRIIQSLDSQEFTLQRLYDFESQLSKRFPGNNCIRPKIRQQLQVLRDAGLLDFMGRGRYLLRK